jgi:hypothetical protein
MQSTTECPALREAYRATNKCTLRTTKLPAVSKSVRTAQHAAIFHAFPSQSSTVVSAHPPAHHAAQFSAYAAYISAFRSALLQAQ